MVNDAPFCKYFIVSSVLTGLKFTSRCCIFKQIGLGGGGTFNEQHTLKLLLSGTGINFGVGALSRTHTHSPV